VTLICVPSASAWDSATHRAIARLAVNALPPSPLRSILSRNEAALETHSVEPDSVLKKKFGKAEERRHYINIEWFGSDPWSALNPDIQTMRGHFGDRMLERTGILPWTIEAIGDQLEEAWHRGDCETMLRLSGYLAHYVGDASQPLHSTIHYDGYARDRGIHARIELAVDHSLGELTPMAAREVHVDDLNDVWAPVIAEIRDANALVGKVIHDDRAAREDGDYGGRDYQRAVMREDASMYARQIARAASVLASLWLYEWRRAGSPPSCAPDKSSSSHGNSSSETRAFMVR
jgi:Zinc dependent phospholipase C